MEQHAPLAIRRKALGLSQAQLAAMLGLTQATISRNEKAEIPDRRFVLALEAIEARQASAA
jgi:transcriptional regulator with XRE-family HTH domain